jgi:chromosome segregation ATPase
MFDGCADTYSYTVLVCQKSVKAAAQPGVRSVEKDSRPDLSGLKKGLKEKRKAYRFAPSDIPLFRGVQAGGSAVELVNASRGGAMVESDSRLAPGRMVSVSVNAGGATYVLRGRVLRSEVAGLSGGKLKFKSGIEFHEEFSLLPDNPSELIVQSIAVAQDEAPTAPSPTPTPPAGPVPDQISDRGPREAKPLAPACAVTVSEKEFEILKLHCSKLEDEVRNSEAQCAQLTLERDLASGLLMAARREAEERATKLRHEVSDLQQRLAQMDNHFQAQRTALETTVRELTERGQVLREALTVSESALSELDDQVQQAREQAGQAQAELARQHRAWEAASVEAEARLAQVAESYQARQRESEANLHEHERRASCAEEQLLVLERNMEDLHAQLQEERDRGQNLLAQAHDRFEAALRASEKELETLKFHCSKLEDEVRNSEARCEQLTLEQVLGSDLLIQARQEAEERATKLRHEVSDLQQRLAQMGSHFQAQRTPLETALRELTERGQVLREALSVSESALSELDYQLQQAREQAGQAHEELARQQRAWGAASVEAEARLAQVAESYQVRQRESEANLHEHERRASCAEEQLLVLERNMEDLRAQLQEERDRGQNLLAQAHDRFEAALRAAEAREVQLTNACEVLKQKQSNTSGELESQLAKLELSRLSEQDELLRAAAEYRAQIEQLQDALREATQWQSAFEQALEAAESRAAQKAMTAEQIEARHREACSEIQQLRGSLARGDALIAETRMELERERTARISRETALGEAAAGILRLINLNGEPTTEAIDSMEEMPG